MAVAPTASNRSAACLGRARRGRAASGVPRVLATTRWKPIMDQPLRSTRLAAGFFRSHAAAGVGNRSPEPFRSDNVVGADGPTAHGNPQEGCGVLAPSATSGGGRIRELLLTRLDA